MLRARNTVKPAGTRKTGFENWFEAKYGMRGRCTQGVGFHTLAREIHWAFPWVPMTTVVSLAHSCYFTVNVPGQEDTSSDMDFISELVYSVSLWADRGTNKRYNPLYVQRIEKPHVPTWKAGMYFLDMARGYSKKWD